MNTSVPLLRILEPAGPPAHGWALLRLGFRPFYLGAALLACLCVPAWVLALLGLWPWGLQHLPPYWHAHEMLLGFTAAVMIGFLFTAARNWTGLPTPRGALLAAFVLLWLAARVAAVFAPYPVYAALDLALLPWVAATLARLLLRARQHRNLGLVALLCALALCNALFHRAVWQAQDASAAAALHAALACIILIECVMANRVIVGFTQSALPGLRIARRPILDWAILAGTALALVLWAGEGPRGLTAACLALAGAGHLARLLTWHPWSTRGQALLWILHVAHAWTPLGLGLLALAQLGWVPDSLGLHALTVGATGGLVLGMMQRTARGHTGRTLVVSRAEVVALALLVLAALLRVGLPLLAPTLYLASLAWSALAWCVSFAIYLVVYTPWLLRARVDGRDG